jgi:hypothetical protein
MGADEGVVDGAGVVRIGSVVFALIRPTEGHELAFNHWYERDHFYTAGLAAPGVFSAGRFIQPETGWHLALYFVLPGHDEARVAFATEQMVRAAAEDRLFTEREHLHTWSYAVEATIAGTDGVPLPLALDHRYPSLRVAMFDGAPPVVAGPSMTLRPLARIMSSAWDGDVDPDRRRIVLQFASGGSSDDLANARGAVWSGGFVPVVFGTDTHIAG